MKKIAYLLLFLPSLTFGQFDFFGPQPFGEILHNSFPSGWTPASSPSIANLNYVVILDQASQSKVIMQDIADNSQLEFTTVDSLSGANASYGSVLRSTFQMVDENTHLENDQGAGSGPYNALSGLYRLSPIMHSYFSINANAADAANCTDGGSFYISEQANTGYVLIEFTGATSNTKIRAVSQWTYSSSLDSIVEVSSWTPKYLKINGNDLEWDANISNASDFLLADATDLLDIEIAAGSDFNPQSTSYQPNSTASLPVVDSMENSDLITRLPNEVDPVYLNQFGNSASATSVSVRPTPSLLP